MLHYNANVFQNERRMISGECSFSLLLHVLYALAYIYYQPFLENRNQTTLMFLSVKATQCD